MRKEGEEDIGKPAQKIRDSIKDRSDYWPFLHVYAWLSVDMTECD